MIDNDRKRQKQEVPAKKLKQSKEHVLRRFNPYLHLLFNFSPLPNTRIKVIPLLLKKFGLKKLAEICRGERTLEQMGLGILYFILVSIFCMTCAMS